MENADKQQNNSRVIGKPFPKGVSGNPAGRPKGSTLKEYQAKRYREMEDDEKEEELKTMSSELKWRMSEGNPHQTEEKTIDANITVVAPSAIVKKLEDGAD